MKIYTVGHSTHPIETFIDMLSAHGIKQLVDIRTIAGSRYNPQFSEPALKKSLTDSHIVYRRLEKLGGLRPTTEGSLNKAWRNKSFRGYADYMQTNEFAEGIEDLMGLAAENRTAIMCAEAVPWRCHRSLVGDALLVRDIEVLDIMNEKSVKPHTLTPFAHVDGLTITYPETS
jgi:uncharacterized protein (DUF488 family)